MFDQPNDFINNSYYQDLNMNLKNLRRGHSLSEDHILLGGNFTPRLSDIVQLPSNTIKKISFEKNMEGNDGTDSSKPSFKIHNETSEKLFRFEKFRKDSNSINFENGRKRFMSFNLF